MPLAPSASTAQPSPLTSAHPARVRPLLEPSARLLVSRFSYGVTPALAKQVRREGRRPRLVRVAARAGPGPRPATWSASTSGGRASAYSGLAGLGAPHVAASSRAGC